MLLLRHPYTVESLSHEKNSALFPWHPRLQSRRLSAEVSEPNPNTGAKAPQPTPGNERIGTVPRQLSSADRTWQQGQARNWLMAKIKWLVLLLLALVVADLIWQLDSRARIIAGLSLVGIAIGGSVRFFYLAFLKSNPLERIARTLEDREPSLGSRLINILQLRKEADDPQHSELTRKLAERAVDNAADAIDADTLDRAAHLPVKRHQVVAALVPPLLAVCLALAFLPITRIEMLRFLDPLGDHPPYSFTRLSIGEPDDDGHQVTYGDPLLVRVDFTGHEPGEVLLSAHPPGQPEAAVTVPMINKGEFGFVQQLDNVTSDLVLIANTSNKRSRSPERRVTVQLTPQIRSASVSIHPPAYTGIEPSARPWDGKPLRALTGSRLHFEFTSNRPLATSPGQFAPTGAAVEELELTPVEDKKNTVATDLSVDKSGSFKFALTDVEGLESKESREGPLTITFDLPPKISIAEPSNDSFIVATHKLTARIEVDDDYGIRTVRIHRALNEEYSAPLTIDIDPALAKNPRRTTQAVEFDLATLGVQSGDIISFFAEAIDNAPEPHLVQSGIRYLMVISEEEYNDALRSEAVISDLQKKYDDLLDDYADLADQQEELTEKIEALQEKLKNAATDAEKQALQEELNELLEQQTELNEQLMQQADAMENFIRDEPLYDVEKSLQEMLAERAQEIRDSVEQNQKATDALKPPPAGDPNQNPGAQSPPSPDSLQQLAEAAREHRDNLSGGQQAAEEEVSEPLEDIADLHEIVNDYNHFKALYEAQQSIAKQADAYDTGRQLSDADRLALQNLAAQERELGEQLEQLTDKLREDAERARENFPKAASSAEDLADQIESARMPKLADQSSSQMLDGDAPGSSQAAERLRAEMEKLFQQQQQGNQMGQMQSELDSYFQLQQMSGSASTFRQMMMSQRFGFGNGFKPGQGQAGGSGNGLAGRMGNQMGLNPNMGLLGGESLMPNGGKRGETKQRGRADEPNLTGDPDRDDPDKADTLDDVDITNRQSDAVNYETLSEQYRGLVDEYFKTLTTAPQSTENSAAP